MYESREGLPDAVREVLPREAQELYMEAYNESWEAYEEEKTSDLNREAVAHRDGWTAVKREFTKDEKTGKWYPAGEAPERDEIEDEDEGLMGGLEFDDLV